MESMDGATLRVAAAVVTEDAQVGGSIALNGCCLTVTALGPGWWEAEAVAETLSRTNLGRLRAGDAVNLERPVRLADRLGGHLVQGHVDGLAVVRRPPPELTVAVEEGLLRYVAAKGSVALDGCSLTVVDVTQSGFSVAVIPHTAKTTTLGLLAEGSPVNLEVDLLAKYVERLVPKQGTM